MDGRGDGSRSTARGEATRQRIVAAGHDLARRFGIRRLSMEAVAAEVDISRAALYRHFANKASLLDAVLEHNAAIVYETMMAEFSPTSSLVDKVAVGARLALLPSPDILPLGATDPETFAVMLTTGAHPFLARTMNFWLPHVEQAQASGELAAGLDPVESAEWIARSLLSFMSVRPISIDASDPRAVAAYARQYIVFGLAAR